MLAAALGCASEFDRARTAQAEGDLDAAQAHYRSVLEEGGADAPAARTALVELLCERGRALGRDDPAGAEAVYREALELDPTSDTGRLGVARSLLRQGRAEEALTLLDERRGCNGCGRLLAVLLVERGREQLAAGRVEAARADFEQALGLAPDPTAAFGVVETYAVGGAAALAFEAMSRAVPLVAENDVEAQRGFVDLRRRLVLAAAGTGDIELADRYLAMSPPGAGGDAWFDLQLELARTRLKAGDRDFAIARIADVLARNPTELAPSRRRELSAFLVPLYSSRASQYLRAGEVAKAENDLTYALRLDPENWTVKLQRVLAVVALGKLDHAFRMLDKIPPKTEGRPEVSAILWSVRVAEQLAEGDLAGAAVSLEKARQAYEQMPEVHVATAQLLAMSPIAGLPASAAGELRKRGLMRYPEGGIHRYGEALGELHWARTQSEALGPRYPYRAPSTDVLIDSLEGQIRAFYPFTIEFNPEPTTILVLRSRAPARVVVEAPGGVRETVEAADGRPARLTIAEPGLTRITVGRTVRALITEPYVQLTVDL